MGIPCYLLPEPREIRITYPPCLDCLTSFHHSFEEIIANPYYYVAALLRRRLLITESA